MADPQRKKKERKVEFPFLLLTSLDPLISYWSFDCLQTALPLLKTDHIRSVELRRLMTAEVEEVAVALTLLLEGAIAGDIGHCTPQQS